MAGKSRYVPLTAPKEIYRGIKIHTDPWFGYAGFTDHESPVRCAIGKTLRACREEIDDYLARQEALVK